MKKFQYPFWNKTCPDCIKDTVEDFWKEPNNNLIRRSGCYCPQCLQHFDFQIINNQNVWLSRVSYILDSTEYIFIRKIQDSELIKKHGVDAFWFHIGRKVYTNPSNQDLVEKDIVEFEKKYQQDSLKLVYMINNHIQRLYFFVPNDAIKKNLD